MTFSFSWWRGLAFNVLNFRLTAFLINLTRPKFQANAEMERRFTSTAEVVEVIGSSRTVVNRQTCGRPGIGEPRVPRITGIQQTRTTAGRQTMRVRLHSPYRVSTLFEQWISITLQLICDYWICFFLNIDSDWHRQNHLIIVVLTEKKNFTYECMKVLFISYTTAHGICI